MPEVAIQVRWPDGAVQRGTSPSRAIEQAYVAGGSYPVDEFVRRGVAALEVASERVRAKYGFACSSAAALAEALRRGAAEHAPAGAGRVVVQAVRRMPGRPEFPAPESLEGSRDVVVIGGGQAGLAVSWYLTERGVDHLVLERDRIASTWREQRWDAFHLVTPNWQCTLPGHHYPGDDPHGFMPRDEIVAYVEDFARSFDPPVAEGVAVTEVAAAPEGGFRLTTSHGTIRAERVVLAVGGYHQPSIPRIGERLPAAVTQLHSSRYRNPAGLPDGGVLVIGSGQSGAQIAEDLMLSGRRTHLAVGSAPRVARRYRGRDCVAWLDDMGHYDLSVDDHPEGLSVRKEANHYVTGRGGGRDIDLRAHARDGMRLHGRVLDVRDGRVSLAGDLAANLDAADATSERIKDTIDRWIEAGGIEAPHEERYTPVWHPPADHPTSLDLEAEGISTVIWATGFRSDWSWVRVPAFDGTGYPVHRRGETSVPGLFVLGLPWLHTWGSGRFAGIARDAGHVAGRIAGVRDVAAA